MLICPNTLLVFKLLLLEVSWSLGFEFGLGLMLGLQFGFSLRLGLGLG